MYKKPENFISFVIIMAICGFFTLIVSPHYLVLTISFSVIISILVVVTDSRGEWIRELNSELDDHKIFLEFLVRTVENNVAQRLVDEKLERLALLVDAQVERSMRFQKGGLTALGLTSYDESRSDDLFESTKKEIEVRSTEVKKLFWDYHNLIKKCGGYPLYLKLRTPESYKSYLPTKTLEAVESQS